MSEVLLLPDDVCFFRAHQFRFAGPVPSSTLVSVINAAADCEPFAMTSRCTMYAMTRVLASVGTAAAG